MPLSPSSAQSAASRANGALSRGPVTPEGKARSAQNATRHNLRGAAFRLLPGEDRAEFEALLAELVERHAPADDPERACVEEIAFARWRLLRVASLEAAAVAALCARARGE